MKDTLEMEYVREAWRNGKKVTLISDDPDKHKARVLAEVGNGSRPVDLTYEEWVHLGLPWHPC